MRQKLLNEYPSSRYLNKPVTYVAVAELSVPCMVAHCSHKEKQSKCYNKLKILEIVSKLNKNKI